MLQHGKHFYEFDAFRLDTAAGVLLHEGRLVSLTPKAIETLAALLRHPGEVVSKEELMKTVWPDSFVEEANLNVQISALRKALNGATGVPDYIETIPRRGYRFCAEVHEVLEEPTEWVVQKRTLARIVTEEEEITAVEARADALPAPADRALPGANTTPRWVAPLAMLLVVAVTVAAYFRWGRGPTGAPAQSRVLLGVLPLANLSGDPEQEFLSDGMTDELITELGRLNPSQLGVIARASMMPYKGSNKGIRVIAEELGLKYVLEGSLIHTKGRLRINMKLIQASDQAQVWANEYDRDEKDLFQVQGEVARAVAREILGRVAPGVAARGTPPRSVKPEAYEAYLRGRFFWWKRELPANERARAFFQQAIQLDSGFARAYSGMADTYVGGAKGREWALKAVELDDSLAEAQTSLALITWSNDLDWAGAESRFRRALELDPYYVSARHWYGFMLIFWGRGDEAIQQLERARETDPLNNVVLTDLGQALYWKGQYHRAREQLNKAIDMDPAFPWPHYWLGRVYEAQGQVPQALAEYEQAWDQPLGRMDKNTALACLYAKMGQPEKARQILRDIEKRDILPRNHALILVALGENERAIEVLEQGARKLKAFATALWMEPGLAPLRSDPRIQRLIDSVAPPTR